MSTTTAVDDTTILSLLPANNITYLCIHHYSISIGFSGFEYNIGHIQFCNDTGGAWGCCALLVRAIPLVVPICFRLSILLFFCHK